MFENKLGCASCHQQNDQGRGPKLAGVFGKEQKLTNGQTVLADDEYIRNSILNPTGQIVEGYQPIMPTFKGQVTEEQLVSLVAYIKSLGSGAANAAGSGAASSTNQTGASQTNNSNSTNLVVPRADRGDSNSMGSNPNAPKNTSEPTRKKE